VYYLFFYETAAHVQCNTTYKSVKTVKLHDSMSCDLHSMHIVTVTINKHTMLKINM